MSRDFENLARSFAPHISIDTYNIYRWSIQLHRIEALFCLIKNENVYVDHFSFSNANRFRLVPLRLTSWKIKRDEEIDLNRILLVKIARECNNFHFTKGICILITSLYQQIIEDILPYFLNLCVPYLLNCVLRSINFTINFCETKLIKFTKHIFKAHFYQCKFNFLNFDLILSFYLFFKKS